MATIGKGKYHLYRNDEDGSSDDDSDDDRDVIIDEDDDSNIVCAASPVTFEQGAKPDAVTKKKSKRKSAAVIRQRKSLVALIESCGGVADAANLNVYQEKNPPSRKRKRDDDDEEEDKKPKKYTAYLWFLKTNMASATDVVPNQRMKYVSKKWEAANQELKDSYQAMAEEANKRLNPNYQPSAPKEKKAASDPILAWVKEKLSKMPEHQNTSKKDLHKLAKTELKNNRDRMVEEFKRS